MTRTPHWTAKAKTDGSLRHGTLRLAACLCLAAFTVPLAAQPPATQPGEDVMRPTELGMRLTPGMARAFARYFVKDELAVEFELNEPSQAKAADAIARRLMESAHKNAPQAQAFLEGSLQILMETEGQFTPESGKRWAELNKPMIPAFRELITKMAEDVRPLVPLKHLPGFTGRMLMISTAMEAYEKRMDRWAKGEAREQDNPFRDELDLDEDDASPAGESVEVRRARRSSDESVKWLTGQRWKALVESAIRYYVFTEPQKESARSILREIQYRGQQVQTDEWKARFLANRMRAFVGASATTWHSPYMWELDREEKELCRPFEALTEELQDRLMQVPTTDQKDAALGRIKAHLEKQGLKP